MPALISVNRSSFDLGFGEHPVEGAVLANGKQPGDDLLLGLREDRGIELRFEEFSRAAFEINQDMAQISCGRSAP